MKNIAICYGEHAIKVSDSYCSGPSGQAHHSSSQLTPSARNEVTCVYKVKPSDRKQFLIRVRWCKQFLEQGFSIGFCEYPFSTSKFGKNSTVLRKARGTKVMELSGSRVEVVWDLTRARYDSGPEPCNDFYVAVVVDKELSLVLGDIGQDLVDAKKRALDLKVSEFALVSKNECYSGNSVYSTRARFSETGAWHDILIRCFGEAGTKNNGVLCVDIDRKNVIEVRRLGWNFRGNQTIFLDGLLVDLMWDVHDWFFGPVTGYAVFMFRTRSGFDSRLWLEEEKKKIDHQGNGQDKGGFSLSVFASKNPD